MRRKCFRALALAAGLVGWSANMGLEIPGPGIGWCRPGWPPAWSR